MRRNGPIKWKGLTPEERERRATIRRAIAERDKGCVLMALDKSHQCFGGPTPHHLVKASRGGEYQTRNMVVVCASGNTWVEDNPRRAHELGLVARWGETALDCWQRMADATPGHSPLSHHLKLCWIEAAASAETDDCIEWPWARTTGGYGVQWLNGEIRKAHHATLLAAGKEPPSGRGREVRHLCNHPPCVNVNHLVVGTTSENQLDRRAAGTSNAGERNGRTKLTNADAAEIRRRYRRTRDTPPIRSNCTALAREFGVSGQTILRIVNGETFAA